MKIIWNQIYTGMPSNNFEDKIRQKFDGAKVAPSPEVWAQLSGRLQEKKQKGLILPLFKWGSISTVTAAACLGIWLMNKSVDTQLPIETPMVSQESITPNSLAAPASESEETIVPIEPIEKLAAIELTTKSSKDIHANYFNPSNKNSKGSNLLLPPIGAKIKTFERAQGGTWPLQGANPFAWNGLPNVRSQSFYADHSFSNRKSLKAIEPAMDAGFSNLKTVSQLEGEGILPPVVEIPQQMMPLNIKPSMKGNRLSYGVTAMSLFQLRNISTIYVENSLTNSFATPPVGLDVRQVVTSFHYPDRITGLALKMEYALNRVFSLEAGLGLIKGKTINGRYPSLYEDTRVQASASPSEQKTLNQLDYTSVAIPLLVNMRLGRGKHKIKASVGMLSQWLISQQEKSIRETFIYANPTGTGIGDFNSLSAEGKTNLLPKNMLNILARLQYEYYICDRISIGAGPILSYGLQPSFTYGNQNGAHGLMAGVDVEVNFFPKF